MKIAYIHFYVLDAVKQRLWFVNCLGFRLIRCFVSDDNLTYTEVIKQGSIYFLLSSPLGEDSPVARYLNKHPSGIADVAFYLDMAHNEPITVKGWGDLNHTLLPHELDFVSEERADLISIDHVVLNVMNGDLAVAIKWYQELFNFEVAQTFKIETDYSGLYSQALVAPLGNFWLNINEPISDTSQIQEFLDHNHGSGIQHIALLTNNILESLSKFSQNNLSTLSVPASYYAELWAEIPDNMLTEWEKSRIEELELLVDYQVNKLLLQTFTHPLFDEPTLFLEIIERRNNIQGFGERNFKALFEAIEREQLSRTALISNPKLISGLSFDDSR